MKKGNITLNGSQAGRLCGAMTAASLFTVLVIDGAEYMQSSWLCAVLGFFISLPIILISARISGEESHKRRVIFAVISAYMAYKAAATARLLINSVSYSNLEIIPPWLIMLLMTAACFYIITRNGGGIGNGIKLVAIAALVLMIMVGVASLEYMNWRWLKPLGGAGGISIIKGMFAAAGDISAAGLICITADNGERNRLESVKGAAVGAVVGVLLCVYSAVMIPVQFSDIWNRLANIEKFLSNGRTALGVQLPITILWFLGYIAALGSYSFASAAFLQKSYPDMRGRIAGFISLTVMYVMAGIGLVESDVLRMVNNFAYAGVVLIISALCIIGRGKNEAAL